jgi:hypothetical protein
MGWRGTGLAGLRVWVNRPPAHRDGTAMNGAQILLAWDGAARGLAGTTELNQELFGYLDVEVDGV